MNILVTAGNTQSPIDRVRCITNVFTGRTGGRVAQTAAEYGHAVTLLTSHPEVLGSEHRVSVHAFRTFEDLEALMERMIPTGGFDSIVHCAAVNDYHVVGTFAREGEAFVDVSAGKVKGHHPDLWLRMKPAPKLIDKVRTAWHFAGILVKFKLEVGAPDAELLDIAERSRVHSAADLMVANTLEGMQEWAYLGAGAGGYRRIARGDLAAELVRAIEARHTPGRLD